MGCPHGKDVAFRVITCFRSPVSPSKGCSYTVGTDSLLDSGRLSPGPPHGLPDLGSRAHQPVSRAPHSAPQGGAVLGEQLAPRLP